MIRAVAAGQDVGEHIVVQMPAFDESSAVPDSTESGWPAVRRSWRRCRRDGAAPLPEQHGGFGKIRRDDVGGAG